MSPKPPPKHLRQVESKDLRETGKTEKPRKYGVYFVIMSAVFVIALLLIFWDRFTVREIEVEGLDKVNYLEVIHLSGIEYLSNIFTIDLQDVRTKIEQNPMLYVVDTKRQLPDTIVITIEERQPIALIKSQEGSYAVINKDCIAIGILDFANTDENAEILGAKVLSFELGQKIELEKEIQSKKLSELLNAMYETQIQNLIESIDVSFTENIKLYSKSGYEMQIGSTENIENKCLWIKTMIPKLIEEGREGGTLYITNVNSAHYIAPNSD